MRLTAKAQRIEGGEILVSHVKMTSSCEVGSCKRAEQTPPAQDAVISSRPDPNPTAPHQRDAATTKVLNGKKRIEPMDFVDNAHAPAATVDNDEAVIHRVRLCPQAPQAPNYFVGKTKQATTTLQ